MCHLFSYHPDNNQHPFISTGRLGPSSSPERTDFLQKTIGITHGGGENASSSSWRLLSEQEGQLRSLIYTDEGLGHRLCGSVFFVGVRILAPDTCCDDDR